MGLGNKSLGIYCKHDVCFENQSEWKKNYGAEHKYLDQEIILKLTKNRQKLAKDRLFPSSQQQIRPENFIAQTKAYKGSSLNTILTHIFM